MLSLFPQLGSLLSLWLQTCSIGLWMLLVILVAWCVSYFTSANSEVIRKIVHIGTGHVILIAWWLNIPSGVGITASICACIVTLLSYKLPIIPGINSVGRKSLGTFFYAASIGILITYFWHLHEPQYAVLGVMVMTWGDGLAALVGQRFGKHKYKTLGREKSWEGSLAMCLTSWIVASLILITVQGNLWQIWMISVVVALIATALESLSFLGIDNLTVPLGTATIAFALTKILV
ncbi:diacylglycerol/polyprenol kinase family protein [Richelia intracellularis]|nr:diacylglycerol/polyprenol kinase family protein [Richelia intracellularis]